jgi:hypothetical protein
MEVRAGSVPVDLRLVANPTCGAPGVLLAQAVSWAGARSRRRSGSGNRAGALADKLPAVAEHLDAARADVLAFTASGRVQ